MSIQETEEMEKDVKQYQGDIISRIQTGGNATGKNTHYLLHINCNEKDGERLTGFDWGNLHVKKYKRDVNQLP